MAGAGRHWLLRLPDRSGTDESTPKSPVTLLVVLTTTCLYPLKSLVDSFLIKIKACEPTPWQMHAKFVNELARAAYAVQITDQHNTQQQLRINRRTASIAIAVLQPGAQRFWPATSLRQRPCSKRWRSCSSATSTSRNNSRWPPSTRFNRRSTLSARKIVRQTRLESCFSH